MSDHTIGSLEQDKDAETSDKNSQAMIAVLSSGEDISCIFTSAFTDHSNCLSIYESCG